MEKLKELKAEVMFQINSLKEAVDFGDIPTIIKYIDIDTRRSTALIDYLRALLIEFITDHIKKSSLDALKVKRKGEYGITFDYYRLKDDELYRNGHPTKYDGIGNLYQAYKCIKK